MPARRARLLVALGVGLYALAIALVQIARHPGGTSDFDHLWHAAHFLWRGIDPYAAIGPGRMYDFPWPLYYPLPAVLAVAPLAALPMLAARAAFVGVAAALLAYAVTRDGYARLPLFVSASFVAAARAAQWSPLMTAAALLAPLAWLTTVKPTTGLALLAGARDRVIAVAAVGGAALLALSFAVEPGWVAGWMASVRNAPHLVPPLLRTGGVLVLLALLKWRRPEARMLVALACVPQTTVLYETVPLFLVPRTLRESLILALCSDVALLLTTGMPATATSQPTLLRAMGNVVVPLTYLPALVMVLRRPNEGEVPVLVTRLVAGVRARVPHPRRAAAAEEAR